MRAGKNKLIRYAAAVCAAVCVLLCGQSARAQYWQAANQLTNLISPALSGSGAYKGSVELMGVAGVGNSKLNHIELATSQGYQYNSWFYMGVGLGVDIVKSTIPDTDMGPDQSRAYTSGFNNWWMPGDSRFGSKRTGVMIPIFSDFRFDIPMGGNGGASMFIDLRFGASWMVGSRYIETTGGYLSNDAQFYFRPSIGARIPINSQNPKQAINIGVAYLLLTSGNNYWYYDDTQTFSAVGATVSFEW